MTRRASHIIFATFVVLFTAGTAVLVGAERRQRAEVTCPGLCVHFEDGRSFVTEDQIKGYMDRYYGTYIGQRADSVSLSKVESTVERQSAVENCEAWTDAGGLLHIAVTQRVPVLRIQTPERGFYIDDAGCIFPLQGNYTARVPVIDGAIPFSVGEGYKGEAPDEESKEWVSKILSMYRWTQKSRVWADRIVQFHVSGSEGLVLVPRQGGEKFIFGNPDRVEEKFARIEKYYRYILPSKEGNPYRTVDVRYEGQIVCRQ